MDLVKEDVLEEETLTSDLTSLFPDVEQADDLFPFDEDPLALLPFLYPSPHLAPVHFPLPRHSSVRRRLQLAVVDGPLALCV